MGYSINPELITERGHLLLDLARGLPAVWTVSPPSLHEARRLVYNIRECLHIASLYPDRFPELARAADMFSLHVVDGSRVEARPKTRSQVVAARGDTTRGTPIHGGEIARPQVPQVGLTTAEELIDSWQRQAPSQDPILFQRTTLDTGELIKLYAWAQRPPRKMILVGEDHITLSLYEAETASIAAWSPPEPQPEEEKYNL